MLLEPQRHFAFTDRRDDVAFHGVPAQQRQGPTDAAFRRFATRQSDDLLPLAGGERRRGSAPRRIEQRTFEPFGRKMFADAANRPLRAAHVFDDLLVGVPLVGLEQHESPPNDAHRTRPRLRQLL